jgi:diacylglycerol kinase family enzyme
MSNKNTGVYLNQKLGPVNQPFSSFVNSMSFELTVPRQLEQAAELICQSSNIRKIDVAKIGDQHFMLRAYSGIEESDKTSRENKDRYGNLAYIVDTLHTIENPPHAQYRFNIDGQQVEEEGLTCLILNAGSRQDMLWGYWNEDDILS